MSGQESDSNCVGNGLVLELEVVHDQSIACVQVGRVEPYIYSEKLDAYRYAWQSKMYCRQSSCLERSLLASVFFSYGRLNALAACQRHCFCEFVHDATGCLPAWWPSVLLQQLVPRPVCGAEDQPFCFAAPGCVLQALPFVYPLLPAAHCVRWLLHEM